MASTLRRLYLRHPTLCGIMAILLWCLHDPILLTTKHISFSDQTLLTMIGASFIAVLLKRKKDPVFLWPHSFIYGICLFSAYQCQAIALKLLPIDMYKCISSIWPISTLLFLAAFTTRKYSLICILCALVSNTAIIINYWGIWHTNQSTLTGTIITLIMIFSWVCYSTGFVKSKNYLTDGFAGIFIICAALCMILSFQYGSQITLTNIPNLGLLLASGVITVLIANIFWINGLQHGQSAQLINIGYLYHLISTALLVALGLIAVAPQSLWSILIIASNCFLGFYISRKSK